MAGISMKALKEVLSCLEQEKWLEVREISRRCGMGSERTRTVLRHGVMMNKVERKSVRKDTSRDDSFAVTTKALWRLAAFLLCMVPALASAQAVQIDEAVTPVGTPASVQVNMIVGVSPVLAWSFGVVHEPGMTLVSALNPVVADYVSMDLYPDGFTAGVVLSFTGVTTGFPGGTIVDAVYTGQGAIRFQSLVLGSPPVENLLVGPQATVLPTIWVDGSVTVNANFQRGDCDSDGAMTIVDVVALLDTLFVAGAAQSPCDDACDSNDDGFKDLSDVLYSLGYMFDGGLAPPSPVGICGPDVTADLLGCASSPACP